MRSTETPSEAQRKLPLHTEEKGFEGNNRSAAIYATDILGETEQQQSSRLNGHDRKDLESTETQLPGARKPLEARRRRNMEPFLRILFDLVLRPLDLCCNCG